MPDTVARLPILEEEVNSPVNDDCDLPISEQPIAEKEDHSEDETQVEEPDPVTEESRGIHDQCVWSRIGQMARLSGLERSRARV